VVFKTMENTNGEKTLEPTFWTKKRWLQIGAFTFAVTVSVLIVVFRTRITALGGYGYLGTFLVPLLCSATLFVPVPGLVIVFTLGSVLNPMLVGLISGVGATLGETTGYLLGYGGRAAIENVVLYKRIENWMKRWAPLTLFGLAVIPNPLFDLAGAAAGALKVPIWKYYLYGGAGRIIKHTAFALAGAWGLQSLIPFLK
jgi:membrane protein YqaA with SNARE-associated domain